MVGLSRGAILVATGDIDAQQYLETALKSQGFAVQFADDCEDVRKIIGAANQISLVVVDHSERAEIVREVRHITCSLPIVVITGARDSSGDWSSYTNLLTLPKPVFYDDLAEAIFDLVPAESQQPQPKPPAKRRYFEFFSNPDNPRIDRISKIIDRAARCDVPVLVQGETGVGKEMLVREIHARSRRANSPFVNINCAALPKELVESQLFGHERGAFTGAHRSQPGLFESAEGGTILLDEIGDMDIRLQAKLLQVLQDNEFHRLGGGGTVRVDVRVMAATHRDLSEAVANGQIRADLYYRLKVVSLVIPSLRERREEIVPLAEFFLSKHTPEGETPPQLDFVIKRRLQAYHWPGNVRELENMMRRYLVLRDPDIFPATHDEVEPAPDLEIAARDHERPADRSIFAALDEEKRQAQIDALVAALDASHWNRKKAAELLRMDYKQLLYQIKKLRIEGANRRTRRSRGASKEFASHPLKSANRALVSASARKTL